MSATDTHALTDDVGGAATADVLAELARFRRTSDGSRASLIGFLTATSAADVLARNGC